MYIEDLYEHSSYKMNLKEAYEHARDVAERLAREVIEGNGNGDSLYARCAIEHYQIYLWLKDLAILGGDSVEGE